MRIVYMGTPEFAVAPLASLVEAGYDVVAVVTMPDKPAGRGHHLRGSAVKDYAVAHGLDLLQPANLKDETWLEQLRSYHADLQIVVAFRMLPEVVWSMPRLGTFNLHASLLPEYRGAAPINRAIMNGERRTGVTTFFLNRDIDTGDILLQREVAIEPDDDAGTLHDKLMQAGAERTLTTVRLIEQGSAQPQPQPRLAPKPAPKIFKEDCRMNFSATVVEVHNFVRGLSPHPEAWTELRPGVTVKVLLTRPEQGPVSVAPGTVESDNRGYIRVACADGYIYILELKPEGRRRMTVAEYLRGTKL